MSGVYIDKNGNWKLQLNLQMNLNVETTPKNWESARDIYITGVFKFKVGVNGTNAWNKKFTLTPKNMEITNMKVMKDGKEIEMEQMMIQSVINIQLDNMKKEFKELPFFLKNLLQAQPKELACFGFNMADLDVSFKKSQVQVSAYYKDTKYANKELCEKFIEELRKSPDRFLDKFNDPSNPFMKGLEQAQQVAAGNKTANPFEALGQMA